MTCLRPFELLPAFEAPGREENISFSLEMLLCTGNVFDTSGEHDFSSRESRKMNWQVGWGTWNCGRKLFEGSVYPFLLVPWSTPTKTAFEQQKHRTLELVLNWN